MLNTRSAGALMLSRCVVRCEVWCALRGVLTDKFTPPVSCCLSAGLLCRLGQLRPAVNNSVPPRHGGQCSVTLGVTGPRPRTPDERVLPPVSLGFIRFRGALTGFPAPRIVAATSTIDNYSQGENMSSLSFKSGVTVALAASNLSVSPASLPV